MSSSTLCNLFPCLSSSARPASSWKPCNKIRKEATKLHNGINLLSDTVGIIGASNDLLSLAANNPSAAFQARSRSLARACSTTSGLLNCIDTGVVFTQCLTGAAFYQTNEDGSFVLQTETLSKKTSSGEIVTYTKTGKVAKSPLSIAALVTRIASKVLRGTVFSTSTLRFGTLGTHATKIGCVGTCLSAVSSACCATENAVDIVGTVRSQGSELPSLDGEGTKGSSFLEKCKILRATIFSLLCDLIDIVCELADLVTTCVPTIFGAYAALVTGILCFASASLNFIRDYIG